MKLSRFDPRRGTLRVPYTRGLRPRLASGYAQWFFLSLLLLLPGCSGCDRSTPTTPPTKSASPSLSPTSTPKASPTHVPAPKVTPKVVLLPQLRMPSPSPSSEATSSATPSPSPKPSLQPSPTPSAATATPESTPESAPLITIHEAAQLSPKNERSNIGLGMRSSNGEQSDPLLLPSPTPEESETESPTPTPAPRFSGQPRGYTMLYLMHPRARMTVERQLQAMIDSGVQEVYVSALMDGTFGFDLPYFATVLNRLAAEKRSITLQLYLTNGASQREYLTTPITAGFVHIEPAYFRELIRYSPGIRADYQKIVRSVEPLINLNQQLGPSNNTIIVPMLEDNLDTESYRAMRDLAKEILGSRVTFMRNPCANCYEGNDDNALGDARESHSPSMVPRMPPGDGFSFDGSDYSFPWEEPVGLPIEDVKTLAAISAQRGHRFFALWRGARQGGYAGQPRLHPDKRVYEVPSDEMLAIEVDLLRAGLRELKEEAEQESEDS